MPYLKKLVSVSIMGNVTDIFIHFILLLQPDPSNARLIDCFERLGDVLVIEALLSLGSKLVPSLLQ